MKEYLIGRWNEADIVINDESDQVSRKHAIATRYFWGKLTLRDISANGTFLNGQPLSKNVEVKVQKNDSISLAKVWDFNLSSVPDPYKSKRVAAIFAIVLCIVLLVGGGVFLAQRYRTPKAIETPPAVQKVPDSSAVMVDASDTVQAPKSQVLPKSAKKRKPIKKNKAVQQAKPKTEEVQPTVPQEKSQHAPREANSQKSPFIY